MKIQNLKNLEKYCNTSLRKAFTLVELIIVITILSILSTIGLMSFQGYMGDARDASRTSSLDEIRKGLEIYEIKNSNLPLPTNYITITASGTPIGYQGIFGKTEADLIKMTSLPIDPLDNTGYVYSINSLKNKFQLLTFLENQTAYNKPINDVYAIDYSNRKIKTIGDKLGIILNNDNSPITSIVDVVNTNVIYKAIIDNTNNITGTGFVLKSLRAGGELTYGLVGYWSFDEGNGNTVYSNITKSNITSTGFQDNINFSYTGGKIGKGLFFTGASLTGLTIDTGLSYNDFSNGETVSFWVKTFPGFYNGTGNGIFGIGNYWCHLYSNSSINKTYIRFIPDLLNNKNIISLNDGINRSYSFLRKTIGNVFDINSTYIDNQYHLHTISFNNRGKMSYFVDNNKIFENDSKIGNFEQQFVFSGTIDSYAEQKILENTIIDGIAMKGIGLNLVNGYKNGYYYNPKYMDIGKSGYGIIDEIRIYNRALSDSEIKALYDSTK